MIAMLVYLAGLVQYGHTPGRIGTIRIGKTVYAAGEYITRPLQSGSVPIPSETRIALFPLDNRDYVPVRDLYTDPLLPASYRRSSKTVYWMDGRAWYIAGWNDADYVFWMAQLPSTSKHFEDHKVVETKDEWWSESYDDALKMSSAELLSRI